jgi:hypothetical protein
MLEREGEEMKKVTDNELESFLHSSSAKERVEALKFYICNWADDEEYSKKRVASILSWVLDAMDDKTGWEHIAPAWLRAVRKKKGQVKNG